MSVSLGNLFVLQKSLFLSHENKIVVICSHLDISDRGCPDRILRLVDIGIFTLADLRF